MITKQQRKDIRQYIESFWCYSQGFAKLNGGYALIKSCRITLKKDYILAEGIIISGLEDTGNGHSSKYTDEFELKFKLPNNSTDKLEMIK